MNDLVYIKYNQALKERFDLKDQLDPISLDHIDESNEWLVGTLEEDNEPEADNELVFDEDDLTWGDVARASGVREPLKYTRSKGKSTAASTSTVGTPSPTIRVVSDEDDDDVEELDIEEENCQGGALDEDLDLDGEENDDFDI